MPNWFDAGNALLGAGTGLLGGIDKLQQSKRDRALALKQSGYEEDAEGGLIKSKDLQDKEARDRAVQEAGLLEKGIRIKKNDELGGYDINQVGGNKRDLDTQMKQLQMKKLKQDIDEGPKPSDQQANAAIFGRRAQESEQDFNRLKESGYDPSGPGEGLKKSLAGPLGLLHSFGIGGKYTDVEKPKLQEQAERNLVNAFLRKESGAAISKDEFANAEKQYLPRAGDTPQVLAQKERNRQLSTQGLLAAAGKRALKGIPEPVAQPSLGGASSPPRGMINSAQAAMPHTKESLSGLSDEQLRAELAKVK